MTRSPSSSAASAAFASPVVTTSRGRPAFAGSQSLAREPLVHFALLGALVFAGHHLIAPPEREPVIRVSAAKQRELFELFEQRQQRAPDAGEQRQTVEVEPRLRSTHARRAAAGDDDRRERITVRRGIGRHRR